MVWGQEASRGNFRTQSPPAARPALLQYADLGPDVRGDFAVPLAKTALSLLEGLPPTKRLDRAAMAALRVRAGREQV